MAYDPRDDVDGWSDEPLPELPGDLPPQTLASLQEWRDTGLGLPYIPARFAAATFPVPDMGWNWQWRPRFGPSRGRGSALVDPMDAYRFAPEVKRFTDGDWRPRFLVGHAGHGVNSYSVNYVIVDERVAIFAQSSCGGVYTDNVAAAQQVRRMTNAVADLHRTATALQAWPGGRLLVAWSSFRGAGSTDWLAEPGQDRRNRDRGGLQAAQAILWELQRQAGRDR